MYAQSSQMNHNTVNTYGFEPDIIHDSSWNYQKENNTPSTSKYKLSHIYQPAPHQPQQYAANIYVTSDNPCFVDPNMNHADRNYVERIPCQNSIQHDFYAKPSIFMPKIAPDPPNLDMYKLRREKQ